MASTTGNMKELPNVIVNSPESMPDADQVMADMDALNDKNYICTEATVPPTPYAGQEIFVTDCDYHTAKRVYTSSGWKIISLMDLG